MIENKALTDRQLAALNGELGWNAKADEDGKVGFDSGLGFRIWLSNYAPRDPEYVHMQTGFRLTRFLEQAGSPLDLSRADIELRLLAVAARLTRRLKGVKVMMVPEDDMVIFSVEVIAAGPDRLPSVEHLAAIGPRLRSMITAGVRDFHEEVVLMGLETVAPTTESSDLPG